MSQQTIHDLRNEIQTTNKQIIELIAKRQRIAKRIGAIKRNKGTPIHQPEQEKQVLKSCKHKAESAGLDPDAIQSVFAEIIAICRKSQQT